MSKDEPQRSEPPTSRRFCVTPDRLVVGILLLGVILLLCARCGWIDSDGHKGWSVLIAVAVVIVATVLLLLWYTDSLIYRRRFRMGARSLVSLIATAVVVFSWLANEVRQAGRQRSALACIDETTYSSYSYPADELGWAAYWPRRVLGDDFFVSVEYVSLGGPEITDTAIANLSPLRDLRRLSLESTQVSDAGLVHLKAMPQLQELYIGHSPITDVGMGHLKGLRLRKLHLNGTQVSDVGLEHLKRMTSLRVLSLHGTKFTDEAMRNLGEALPNCKIEHY